MRDESPLSSVSFGRIASTVAVRDIAQSLDFYVGVLGMSVAFENGDPVSFVILEREGAELHLALDRGHEASANNVAHLMVSDAALVFDYVNARGVTIIKAVRDTDYGMRGFVMSDPDGNRIDVGEEL